MGYVLEATLMFYIFSSVLSWFDSPNKKRDRHKKVFSYEIGQNIRRCLK